MDLLISFMKKILHQCNVKGAFDFADWLVITEFIITIPITPEETSLFKASYFVLLYKIRRL